MESDRIEILDVKFDAVTAKEAARRVLAAIGQKSELPFTVVTPNPLIVMNAQNDTALMSALSGADLSLPDGIGIIGAARRFGTPLPERVTGVDTGDQVLSMLAKVGGSVYLLGAAKGVAEEAAERMCDRLEGLRVAGTHHGYFVSGGKDERKIIAQITATKPDLLIVCISSPRQEVWVSEHINELRGVGAVMCLGGALDVWSGRIRRAPRLFLSLRAEWLWRMIRQPKRIAGLGKLIRFRYLTRRRRKDGVNLNK